MYKFAEHTADIKIIAESKSFKGLMQSLGDAFIEVLSKDKIFSKKNINLKKSRKIKIKSETKEMLVVDFLEKILTFCEINGFFPAKVKIISANSKNIETIFQLFGEKSFFSSDVKAVTYHQLILKHNPSKRKWQTEVVLDV